MYRFLTPAGEIDETAISAAVDAGAKHCAWFMGREQTAAERRSSEAFYRAEANRQSALRFGWTEEQWMAAVAFVQGVLAGMADPVDMSDYRTPSTVSGSHERAQHWTGELAARQVTARLAAFDRCLAAIAASRDISQYLQAAE